MVCIGFFKCVAMNGVKVCTNISNYVIRKSVVFPLKNINEQYVFVSTATKLT